MTNDTHTDGTEHVYIAKSMPDDYSPGYHAEVVATTKGVAKRLIEDKTRGSCPDGTIENLDWEGDCGKSNGWWFEVKKHELHTEAPDH